MRHGSLFSGIGGFDLAAEWMGWENVFHCEINEFGRENLKYYWPEAISYEDITKTDFTIHRGNIDILTGGFPCQPYSLAGKRLGKEDERHLWPEMLRAIREIQPRWVVGENVRGIISWNGGVVFDEVQADLETQGYQVLPFLLPAAGVGAEHERFRVWFIAYNNKSAGFQDNRQAIACNEKWNSSSDRKIRPSVPNEFSCNTQVSDWTELKFIEPILCDSYDGFPKGIPEKCIESLGNAIVPQIALQIFKAIEQYEKLNIMT